MKKWEIALLLALCLSSLAGMWAAGRQQRLADRLIRLHVIAVSDSERDQAVKLSVRDEVLRFLEPALRGIGSREGAEEKITALLPEIERTAAQAAASAEAGYGAAAALTRESYPTRYYEGFALPAGEYLSLRVVLGEGEGRNWWCVIFPPLCAPAAEGAADASLVLDGDDMSLITEADGYVVKFKVLELWGMLKRLMARR